MVSVSDKKDSSDNLSQQHSEVMTRDIDVPPDSTDYTPLQRRSRAAPIRENAAEDRKV